MQQSSVSKTGKHCHCLRAVDMYGNTDDVLQCLHERGMLTDAKLLTRMMITAGYCSQQGSACCSTRFKSLLRCVVLIQDLGTVLC
jgi:hypothetical protein